MVSHTTVGPTILLIRIGSINRGLNTTGAPNINGSLILNKEGPIQILPMVLSFLLLEPSISTFKGSVPPRPPMVIKAAVNTASLVAIFIGTPPFATASIFSAIATIKIGVVTALNTQLEIPIE